MCVCKSTALHSHTCTYLRLTLSLPLCTHDLCGSITWFVSFCLSFLTLWVSLPYNFILSVFLLSQFVICLLSFFLSFFISLSFIFISLSFLTFRSLSLSLSFLFYLFLYLPIIAFALPKLFSFVFKDMPQSPTVFCVVGWSVKKWYKLDASSVGVPVV